MAKQIKTKTFTTPEGKVLPLLPIGYPTHASHLIGGRLKWFTYTKQIPVGSRPFEYWERPGLAQAYFQHTFI